MVAMLTTYDLAGLADRGATIWTYVAALGNIETTTLAVLCHRS